MNGIETKPDRRVLPCRKARENPFRSERVESVPYLFPHSDSIESLARRLAGMRHRGALVGPHGSGKTTLLEMLARRFQSDGYRPVTLFLTEQQRVLPDAFHDTVFSEGDFIFFDGAEQLTWWAWRRFLRASRRASGVLVTTHAPGRLPTLCDCRTSGELLESILSRLISPLPSREFIERLHSASRGNIREALRTCYDLWAEGRWPGVAELNRQF